MATLLGILILVLQGLPLAVRRRTLKEEGKGIQYLPRRSLRRRIR
jgi:hypothetical protein